MFRFLCVAVSLTLAGCATMEGNRAAVREKYLGKPLEVAVKGLGYPSKEMKVGERQVLAWRELDSWGIPCELRLEVDPKGVVVGESLHSNDADACRMFVR